MQNEGKKQFVQRKPDSQSRGGYKNETQHCPINKQLFGTDCRKTSRPLIPQHISAGTTPTPTDSGFDSFGHFLAWRLRIRLPFQINESGCDSQINYKKVNVFSCQKSG
jgi:hypothetical protein